FVFTAPAPTLLCSLSLHDALPILLFFAGLDNVERKRVVVLFVLFVASAMFWSGFEQAGSSLNLFADRYTVLEFESFTLLSTWFQDRKSTRLNSSHVKISYAVFCLK